jgi:hypothetical protein
MELPPARLWCTRVQGVSSSLDLSNQITEDPHPTDLAFTLSILPLDLERREELVGGHEHRAGLAYCLVFARHLLGPGTAAVAEPAPVHFFTEVRHPGAFGNRDLDVGVLDPPQPGGRANPLNSRRHRTV